MLCKIFLSGALVLSCYTQLAKAQQAMVPISLTSSTSSAVIGQPITFTATELMLFLFPGASMTFLDNGVAIPGSATALNQNGAASFTTTLAAGTHSIVAVLNTCCGNSSNAVSVTVVPAGAPALSLSVLGLLAVLLLTIGCVTLTRFSGTILRLDK
jgi:hypothetical protein